MSKCCYYPHFVRSNTEDGEALLNTTKRDLNGILNFLFKETGTKLSSSRLMLAQIKCLCDIGLKLSFKNKLEKWTIALV